MHFFFLYTKTCNNSGAANQHFPTIQADLRVCEQLGSWCDVSVTVHMHSADELKTRMREGNCQKMDMGSVGNEEAEMMAM